LFLPKGLFQGNDTALGRRAPELFAYALERPANVGSVARAVAEAGVENAFHAGILGRAGFDAVSNPFAVVTMAMCQWTHDPGRQ
jgi:hypothetical protein